MRVISFYSYKGGTGRTLLAANMALLAARLGGRVVIADFDLEAPGLPYKLLGNSADSPGITGWLRRYRGADHAPDLGLVDVPIERPFRDGGRLQLLPAGPPPTIAYLRELQDLHKQGLFEESAAVDAFLDLRDAIEAQAQPDLLLIDARTGITTTNAVTNRVLADDVVALTMGTPEQLEGTRAVLRSLAPLDKPGTTEPLGLHVVLSRVKGRPARVGAYEWTDEERERIDEVSLFLREPAHPLSSTIVVRQVHLLHDEALLYGGDVLLMKRDDALDATALHIDYLRVGRALFDDSVDAVFESAYGAESDPAARERLARFFDRPAERLVARRNAVTTPEPIDPRERAPDLAERVTQLRELASRDPAVRVDFAGALLALGARRREVGDREGALTSYVDAVEVYRALDRDDAETFGADLARALAGLGVSLGEVGQPVEGLDAASEAAQRFGVLARADPVAYLPDLAASLNNLSVRQSETGDRAAALDSITEAVAHYRTLAEASPAAYLPDLAMSLNNLSNRQSETGDRAAALDSITEAVAHYRALAEASPAAYLPDLAMSLNNLSNRQSETGDRAAALDSITEAVAHYRALAEASPAVFTSDLAASLNNLSNRQSDTGDRAAALDSITEAVAHYRALAQASPAAYLPDLAMSLNNLSNRQSDTGDRAAALDSITEAVAHYRTLAQASPAAYLPNLAMSLNNLSNRQSDTGDRAAALDSITEAVAHYRALAQASPAAYLPNLAMSLNNLSIRQSDTGDRAAALDSITEAVTIRRSLAEASPAVFTSDLARTLNNLAHRLAENGRRREGEQARAEAARLLSEALAGE